MPLVLRPSEYDVWSRCTAAPAAIRAENEKSKGCTVYRHEDTSRYLSGKEKEKDADEGTAAHNLLMVCLDLNISPRDFIGQEVFVEGLGRKMLVTPEMGEYTDVAIEYIRGFINPKSEVYVEQTYDLGFILPGQKGTADVVVVNGNDLHVFDFKYGKGKKVEVVDNGQLMIYLLGVIKSMPFDAADEIAVHIVQPRIDNIKSKNIDRLDLYNFEKNVRKIYETAHSEDRNFNPGNHCQFCQLKNKCRHLKQSIFDKVLEEGVDTPNGVMGFKDHTVMSGDELSQLWDSLQFISAWANNVSKWMTKEALKGRKFPGLKLVEGRKSARKWRDDHLAHQYMIRKGLTCQHDRYKMETISPTQAETVLGRKRIDEGFKDLYTQEKSAPSLAFEDDDRKEYRRDFGDEMEDLN